MCLCEESFARRIPFMFLEHIAELFEPIRHKPQKIQTFDSILKTQMVLTPREPELAFNLQG